MPPLKDLTCLDCDTTHTDVLIRNTEDEKCPACQSTHIQFEMSLFGGYSIKGNNSASQRPRQAGSFKKAGGK